MHHRIPISLAALLGLVLLNPTGAGVAAVAAQAPRAGLVEVWSAPPLAPRVEPAAVPLAALPDTASQYPRTYWKTGLLIGGILGGIFGGALGGGMCGYSEVDQDCFGATVGGAVMFGSSVGAIGALVGGLFPRD